jgi:hypothetical protein
MASSVVIADSITMSKSTLQKFTIAAIALASVACARNSQTREARIPGERDDCQAAAALLAKNAAKPETFTTLGWCDETGPAALASAWRSLPQDTLRMHKFLLASSNLRDERVFTAAYATARDKSRRGRDRGAALLVLIAQVDATYRVDLIPSSRTEVWRAQLTRESHPQQIAGTSPLPNDARARVAALTDALTGQVPSGAAGLRDPLGVAVQAAQLYIKGGKKSTNGAKKRSN